MVVSWCIENDRDQNLVNKDKFSILLQNKHRIYVVCCTNFNIVIHRPTNKIKHCYFIKKKKHYTC